MEKMKTRFIIAVTGRLSAAADSTAKVELIEELSENLYSRWQDLVSGGTDEETAYAQALEDLGDVDELLAYLDSLGPNGELPRQEDRDFASELIHGVEDVVRETINQTKDAVDQATVIVRNVAEKLKEKYPNGFQGKVTFHVDSDGYEEPAPQGEGQEEPAQREKGWTFAAGYDREHGFFCGTGQSRKITGTRFPSQDIKALDVQLINGDVTLRLGNGPEDDILLSGDVEPLEVRVSDDGVLSIRQGNTASSSFFFLRGLAAADVELTLPRRLWESIQISTVNGDVDTVEGLEAGRLAVKTTSGDAELRQSSCRTLLFKSASGDLKCEGAYDDIQAETSSGDVELRGEFGAVQMRTASGDLELKGRVRSLRCASASGDAAIRTENVPEEMEVSSKSGDCEVRLPEGEGFTLQFSTVSGELETDFPLVGPVGSRSGEAIYLDGSGHSFRLSSISGDISLRKI